MSSKVREQKNRFQHRPQRNNANALFGCADLNVPEYALFTFVSARVLIRTCSVGDNQG